MDISFLIASNRPEELIIECVSNIRDINGIDTFEYEILICHTKELKIDNVTNFVDNNRDGPIAAYNHLGFHAKGDYIITLTDSIILPNNTLDVLIELDNLEKNEHRFIITGLMEESSGKAGLPYEAVRHVPLDKFSMLRFPSFKRKSLIEDFNGHIFNPSFKYHCGDHWLPIFAYLNGYSRTETEKIKVKNRYLHDPVTNHDSHDTEVVRRLINCFSKSMKYDQRIYI